MVLMMMLWMLIIIKSLLLKLCTMWAGKNHLHKKTMIQMSNLGNIGCYNGELITADRY